jgi:malate dehydrogenase (oxaloacetate-decarboxylating)(NADP+)
MIFKVLVLFKYFALKVSYLKCCSGTGSMALAGLLSALRAAGFQHKDLINQRIAILGAGTAGLGVANCIKYGMIQMGLSPEEAKKNFWMLDQKGVLGKGRQANSPAQADFIRDDVPDRLSLEQLMQTYKPTILLGLTGVAQQFSETAIREMSKHTQRPIIFPLSNPTDRAECTAEQAFKWTNGKAIFASGSPFDPVKLNGKMYYPNQANNMFTFPGIGLGAVACGARTVTDRMLFTASTALSASLSEDLLQQGRIFPPLRTIREVSQKIAVAICKTAKEEGVNTIPVPDSDEEIMSKLIEHNVWEPHYASFVTPYDSPH